MKKRIFSMILVICMLIGMMPVAHAAPSAELVGTTQYYAPAAAGGTAGVRNISAEPLTSDSIALGEVGRTTWYVAEGRLDILDRITAVGNVNLILADASVLNAVQGITVAEGNSLTVWAQSADGVAGQLITEGKNGNAAIGGLSGTAGEEGGLGASGGLGGNGGPGTHGNDGGNGGNLTVNGGTVKATALNGAAVGGGAGGNGGNGGNAGSGSNGGRGGDGGYGGNGGCGGVVTVNGGSLEAVNTGSGAGIGGGLAGLGGKGGIGGNGEAGAPGGVSGAGGAGGNGGNGGLLTVNGGTVNAIGENGAGIGGGVGGKAGTGGYGVTGGNGGNGGKTVVNSGSVNAKSKLSAAVGGAIGARGGYDVSNGSAGETEINGGTVLTSSQHGENISDQSGKNSRWTGVVFEGSEGRVYGNPTIRQDLEIPSGSTLVNSNTLTIAPGAKLTVNGQFINDGTVSNNGDMTVNGKITGTGTFETSTDATDNLSVIGIPDNLVFNGMDLAEDIKREMKLVKRIGNQNFEVSGWSFTFQKSTAGRFNNVSAVVDAGQYRVVFTSASGQTVQQKFTVSPSNTVFEYVETYLDGIKCKNFTYGDTITVKVKTKDVGEPLTSSDAPKDKQMALYYCDDQISKSVNVGADGCFTMTFDTSSKKIPAGTGEIHIDAKFKGNSNMEDTSKPVTVTIAKKQLSAQVSSNVEKIYDKNPNFSEIPLTLYGVVKSDKLSAFANGHTASADVQDENPQMFTATDVTLSSLQDFYELSAENVSGTAKIKKAKITKTEITIKAPEAGKQPVEAMYNEGYRVNISWQGSLAADGGFAYDTIYSADVVLVPDGNHKFTSGTRVAGITDPAFQSNGTITGCRRDFLITRRAKILNVSEPVYPKFSDYYGNGEAAKAELPESVIITAEDGTASLPVKWTVHGQYNSALTVANQFDWVAEPGHLDPNGAKLQGFLMVGNADTYKVKHEVLKTEAEYTGTPIDIADFFQLMPEKDPVYSVQFGSGEGAGEGFVQGTLLTVTKAGTFTVKVATPAQGQYASGEKSFTLTVKPRAITIEIKEQTRDYASGIISDVSQVTCPELLHGHRLTSIKLSTDNVDATENGQITASSPVIMSNGVQNVTGCYDIAYSGGKLTIMPIAPTVQAPVAIRNLVYNGKQQTLARPASTDGGTIKYCYKESDNEADWTDKIPTGKNFGSYQVWYKVVGNQNFIDQAPRSVPADINRLRIEITARDQAVPYGSTVPCDPDRVVCRLAEGDRLTEITLTPNPVKAPVGTPGTIMPSGPKIMNGDEDVTESYDITCYPGSMTITRGEPEYIAPAGRKGLKFNKQDQNLISKGLSDHGKFWYRKGTSGPWLEALPQGNLAGQYDDIYYKMDPDSNHKAIEPTLMDPITIASKPLNSVTIIPDHNIFVYDYTGSPIEPGITVMDGNDVIPPSEYTVEYFNNTSASQNEAEIRIYEKEGGNYQLPKVSVQKFTINQVDSKLQNISIYPQNITYGDTFNVTFIPTMLNETRFLQRLFTQAPASETAELWVDGECAGTISGVSQDKQVAFVINTADHTIPASAFDGKSHEFLIKWGGCQNLKPSTGRISATLHKRNLTATFDNIRGKIYDGDSRFTDVALNLSNVQGTDDVSATATGNLEGAVVREEPWKAQVESVSLAGSHKDYYSLFNSDVAGACRITPREVTLKWSNLSLDYTGKPLLPTAVVTNAVPGDEVSVSVTAIGEHTEAGTHTAEASTVSNPNYKVPRDNTQEFTINRIAPEYVEPAAEKLIYNGGEQNLLKEGNEGSSLHGHIRYSTSQNGNYTMSVPQGKDAKTYTVWYKVIGDHNHQDITPRSITVTIEPKDIEGAEVHLGPALTYNGKTQTQEVAYVEVDNLRATFDVSANMGRDAKTYTMKITGKGNFAGTVRKDFEIAQYPVALTPTDNQFKIYGDRDPELTYTVKLFASDKLFGKLDRVRGEAVGDYGYDLGTLHNDNYKLLLDDTAKFVIQKKDLTVEVKIADKQYNGLTDAAVESSRLIGVVQHDVVNLVNGTGTFESENVGNNIPVIMTNFSLEGEDAGNYNLIQPTGITGNIVNEFDPEKGIEYMLSGEGWLKDDLVITARPGFQLGTTNSAFGTWDDTLTGGKVGKGSSIAFYIKNTESGAISQKVILTYDLDKTVPFGSVTIDGLTKWQEFLNEITFDTFYQNSQFLTVEAGDSLSGVAKIHAVLVNKPLTLGQVQALDESQWTEIDKKTEVPAVNGQQFVFYVRIVDNAGNVAYISTDGVEFDTQAPEITGIEDGKTYYTTQKAIVSDKNLATVELNEWAKSNEVILPAVSEKTKYTIKAADKAGNGTKITVTMMPTSEIPAPSEEITVENVTSEYTQEMEEHVRYMDELLNNPNLTDAERNYLTAIKNRAQALLDRIHEAASAAQTEAVKKIESVTPETVRFEDKNNLEQAGNDLKNALESYPGNYTAAEKQQMQNVIERIEAAQKAVANAVAVINEIAKLPASVEPDDEASELKIRTIQQLYNTLTEHEKEIVNENGGQLLDKLLADLVNYQIILGNGSTINPDGNGDLLIVANGNAKKFVSLFVDNKQVSPENYTVISGSTIVSLKNSYLRTLDAKEHSIKFVYSDGETSGSFSTIGAGQPVQPDSPSNPTGPVSPNSPGASGGNGGNGGNGGSSGDNPGTSGGSASQNNAIPQTGDLFIPIVWICVLAVAATGIVVLTWRKKYSGN